jgi:iron complex outermembrane receptor protein
MRFSEYGLLFLSASALALTTPALAQTRSELAPGPANAVSVNASAVVADDTPQAGADSGNTVGELVVTGGLRRQKLQDAPLAVSVTSAQEFEDSGFKEPRELQFLSPSISVSQQGGNGIYIRGSGTASQNSGTEQSVGMVIDGILMGFVDDIGGDITDLDHIEVYRGPQGTQFAKNSTAGLVSISTKRPQIDITSLDAHATYGQYNDTSDNFTVNVPLGDTMAFRFSGSYQHRDGVWDNVVRNEKEGLREQDGLKAKFLWSPKDRTNVFISADYRHELQSPNFPQAWRYCGLQGPTTTYLNTYGTHNLPPCNGALLAGITPGPENSQIVEADYAARHTAAGGASVTVEYPLGDFDFTSLTGVRGMARDFFGPSGSGIKTNSYLINDYAGVQYSQEFRIASPGDKKLTYVGGLFFYERDTHTTNTGNGPVYGAALAQYPNTIYGSLVATSSNGGAVIQKNYTKSDAIFADGTWNVTDKFKLNAGLRFIHDDVSAVSTTVLMPGVFKSGTPNTAIPAPTCSMTVGAPGYSAWCRNFGLNTATNLPIFGLVKPDDADQVTKNGYVYRFSPQYFFTPDIQVYGLVAHGYKGPLIDASVDDFTRIKPEEVQALEAGLKSAFFDHRLTVNVTGFRNKFTNLQTTTFDTTALPVPVFRLANAPGQLSQGGELEIRGKVTDDLTLNFGMTVLDARFTEFKTSCWTSSVVAGVTVLQDTTPGKPGSCYFATHTDPVTGLQVADTAKSTNANGLPVINASKYTVRVGATYSHQLKNGYILDGSANYLWRSDWWSAAGNPTLIDPAYGILNLNIGIGPQSANWKVSVFARNALDKFFYAGLQANNGGSTLVLNPEAVRTVGFSLDYKFRK